MRRGGCHDGWMTDRRRQEKGEVEMGEDQIGREESVRGCQGGRAQVGYCTYMKYWYTCLTEELGIVNTLLKL